VRAVVELGDVARFFNGFAFDSKKFNLDKKGLPLVRIRDVVRGFSETYYFGQYQESFLINNGDLLVGMDGEFNLAYWKGGKALLNQRVCKVETNPGLLYRPYLKFLLEPLLKVIESNTAFVTVKHLSTEDLKTQAIPLPSLERQKEIAHQLERADRLRRLRSYALEVSDRYLQGVFLELFGDPLSNPKGWDKSELGEEIDGFEGGVNFPPIAEGQSASEWRVLKISAVTWGTFNADESKPITPDTKFSDSIVVKRGDLLFSRANTTELVGAVSLVRYTPKKVLLPDKIWRVKLEESGRLHPEFLLEYLRHPHIRGIMSDLASGSGGSMKNISMEKAKTIPVPLPPLELQTHFADIVQKHERVRRMQLEALRQAELLYGTLLARAFGEG